MRFPSYWRRRCSQRIVGVQRGTNIKNTQSWEKAYEKLNNRLSSAMSRRAYLVRVPEVISRSRRSSVSRGHTTTTAFPAGLEPVEIIAVPPTSRPPATADPYACARFAGRWLKPERIRCPRGVEIPAGKPFCDPAGGLCDVPRNRKRGVFGPKLLYTAKRAAI